MILDVVDFQKCMAHSYKKLKAISCFWNPQVQEENFHRGSHNRK